ncbi:hypothetical protein DDF62_09335 [Caulobacter radicis]|uniref:hypothetical protein n=1 Tax=Caulobacter radicis TaxID=2172650 RepID=UPI000D576DE5|nr:hypothetical protein [Caulobacter radicis]PVM90444.1 hypothetical protein DDF62_09335 [Caulobacter radicis]
MRTYPIVLCAAAAVCLTATAHAAPFKAPPTSPQLEAKREQLGDSVLKRPGVQMPDNKAELDGALARKDWPTLSAAVMGVASQDAATKMANWERYQVYRGGGYNTIFMYVHTMSTMAASYERAAQANPALAQTAQGLRMGALSQLIYLHAVIAVDGERCGDHTAPIAQRDRILAVSVPLIQAARTLDQDARRTALLAALEQETLIAPVRDYDQDLCRGGMDEIAAALEKNGDKATRSTSRPGVPGTTIEVQPDAAWTPALSDPASWEARRQKVRETLASRLAPLAGLAAAPAR